MAKTQNTSSKLVLDLDDSTGAGVQPLRGKEYNPWLVAFVVSIATFMEVLDTTIVNVALAHIAGSLGASQEESTWIVTSYLVSNAIILPLSGWLASVFGRKNYFMASIFGFTLCSLACGFADSLLMLVVFRFIQGISGGGLQPLQQAILLDAFPVKKRATGFAITGITVVVAPVLGPTLGGYISDYYSWEWIFYINVPVGVLALMLVNIVVHDLPHVQGKGIKGSMDFIGIGLLALGIGALQIILDKGQIEDWFESNFIVIVASICVLSLVSAIIWLLKQKDPIIDLYLFKNRSYSMACFIIFIAGFVLYSSTVLLPFLVQTHFGYNATTAGLVLSPASVVVLFLMAVAGKASSKMQARSMIIIGFVCIAIGQYYTMQFSPDTDYKTFVLMRFAQVMGLPFIFLPISTIAFMDIAKEKYNKASALFALSRNIGGSIGIAVMTTILARSSHTWQNHLSSTLTPNNPEYQQYLAKVIESLLAHGANPAEVQNMALAKVYNELLRQANLMGYIECMNFIFMTTIILIPTLLFIPKNKVHAHREEMLKM